MKIEEVITIAAEESIGYKKWKNRKWLRTWNDEIQLAIEEKKSSYRKYLQNKTVEQYIEYKKHRAIVRKTTRRQRRDDWDKFVKTLERDITETQRDITGTQRDITGTQRDITGTQRRGFKMFKQLQLHGRDKLKIDPITKSEWKEYCGKLWNEQESKGEEGTEEERRSEVTDDNEGMITIEELNKVLNMQTTGKVAG